MHPLQNYNSINYLNQIGLISVTGYDAADFLQRQFTNDMEQVTESTFGTGAYLTHQGRIIANFLIFKTGDRYLIAASNSLVDVLSKRLRMFVLRSRVEINIEADLVIVGAVGDKAIAKALSVLDLPAIKGTDDAYAHSDKLIFAPAGATQRMGMILPAAEVDLLDRLAAGTDSTDWQRADLLAGYPWITAQTSESLIAQAVNLDLIQSVSFTKGCYPGQEIVARLHYKRRVNRRMARASSSAPLEPGTKVNSPESAVKSGLVVNSVSSANDVNAQLLISLPVDFLSHEILSAEENASISVLRDELPYELPEATH